MKAHAGGVKASKASTPAKRPRKEENAAAATEETAVPPAEATMAAAAVAAEPTSRAVAGGDDGWEDLDGPKDGEASTSSPAPGDEAAPELRPSKAARRRARDAAERSLRERELELASGRAVPRSAAELEALALGSPASSHAWVRYMALHLSLGDVEAARQAAARALRTVPLEEQAERLNVRLALLNLELAAGDDRAAASALAAALRASVPGRARPAAAQALSAAGRRAAAARCLEAWCAAEPERPEPWLAAYELALEEAKGGATGAAAAAAAASGASDEEEDDDPLMLAASGSGYAGPEAGAVPGAGGVPGAAAAAPHPHVRRSVKPLLPPRERAEGVLKRGRASVARRDAPRLAAGAARLEFLLGDPERGRSIFEGLVREAPGRIDIWSVYLDRELAVARGLREGEGGSGGRRKRGRDTRDPEDDGSGSGDESASDDGDDDGPGGGEVPRRALLEAAVRRTRALFKRATHLELPAKKMKFLFGRFLDFEVGFGTPSSQQHVREAAMDFVQRATTIQA